MTPVVVQPWHDYSKSEPVEPNPDAAWVFVVIVIGTAVLVVSILAALKWAERRDR